MRFFTMLLALCFSLVVNANQSTIDEALKSAAQGKPREAIIQLKNVLQKDPENVAARFALGKIYMDYGDVASAEKELRRAQKLGTPLEKVSELILDAYLAQNKFDDISNYLTRYKAKDSKTQALFDAFEGFVKLSKRDNTQAKQLFDQSLASDKGNLRATLGLASYFIGQSQNDEAIKLLSDFLQSNPESIRPLSLRGELYRKTGKLNEAEKDYSAVLAINKNFHQARLGLAFVKAAQNKSDEVFAELKKLPEQMQQLPAVSYMKALSYYLKKDLGNAEANLQDVLKLVPNHIQSHLLSGIIYYAQQKWQLAEDHLSRVNKQVQNNPNVIKLLASSYLKLNELDKAENLLNRLKLTLKQPDAQIYTLLGSVYLQKGDNDRAQELFNQAAAIAPENSDLKTRLAFGMLAGGNTDKAISTLESAVELGENQLQTDVLLVMSYLRAKQLEKALELSRKLQQKYVDSPIPHNLTGLSLMSSGKHKEADVSFKKALSIDSSFDTATVNRARNAMAAGDSKQAEEILLELNKKNPLNITALQGLAQLAGLNKDTAGRESYLQKIIDVDASNVAAVSQLAEILIRRNEPLKALTLISAAGNDANENAALIRIRGMAQLAARQTSSAITTFESLARMLPSNIEANYQLGRAYLLNNELDKASRYFDKAALNDQKKQLPMVWIAMGDVAIKQKNYDKVLKLTSELMDAGTDIAPVYELRAMAYQGLGKTSEVAPLLKQAFVKQPSQQRARSLAAFYNANKQSAKAIDILNQWLSTKTDDAQLLAMRGLIQMQNGDDKGAIDSYQSVVKIKPDNAPILNNLAWLYHKTGDNRAIETAKRAYQLSQKRAEIIDTYGWILFESGQQQQALPILQEALLNSPEHPEIAYHVAVALRKLNRASEAEPILKRILRNSPASPFAANAKQLLGQ